MDTVDGAIKLSQNDFKKYIKYGIVVDLLANNSNKADPFKTFIINKHRTITKMEISAMKGTKNKNLKNMNNSVLVEMNTMRNTGADDRPGSCSTSAALDDVSTRTPVEYWAPPRC